MAAGYCIDRLCGFALLALGSVTALTGAAEPAAAQDKVNVPIVYVTQEEDRPIPLSLLDTRLPDEGLMGARQALTENQTTGSNSSATTIR